MKLSVKDARKPEAARASRKSCVKHRVMESQLPLLEKTGMRSWKAKSVPVGRRLAKLAVLVKVWEMVFWVKEADVGGAVGAELACPGSAEFVVVVALRDILRAVEERLKNLAKI